MVYDSIGALSSNMSKSLRDVHDFSNDNSLSSHTTSDVYTDVDKNGVNGVVERQHNVGDPWQMWHRPFLINSLLVSMIRSDFTRSDCVDALISLLLYNTRALDASLYVPQSNALQEQLADWYLFRENDTCDAGNDSSSSSGGSSSRNVRSDSDAGDRLVTTTTSTGNSAPNSSFSTSSTPSSTTSIGIESLASQNSLKKEYYEDALKITAENSKVSPGEPESLKKKHLQGLPKRIQESRRGSQEADKKFPKAPKTLPKGRQNSSTSSQDPL